MILVDYVDLDYLIDPHNIVSQNGSVFSMVVLLLTFRDLLINRS